jgi:TatD DNase family protein
MITIGTHPADWAAAFDVCAKRDNIRCAIGVHPNYCHEVDPAELPRLRELQSHPAVVALGEMGLDYHYTFADRVRQRMFFESQLQLASELSRAAVIHCREAVDDTLAVMSAFPGVRAVFHCFTGTVAESERIIERGYLLGFTGVVTFKNSDELREAARRTPANRLLVETDAPYLSPEPVRKQKTNEPAFVMHTAAAVARARGVELPELDRITTSNVRQFFGW